MIPKTIHRITLGPTNELYERCWATFQQHYQDHELVTWEDPLNPADFELSHLWPYCTSLAQKADLLRLEIIYRHGGIYVDADTECLKQLPVPADTTFFVGTENGDIAPNSVFGATAGHSYIREMIDFLKPLDSLPSDLSPVSTTGPSLFSRHLLHKEDLMVFPKECFFPWLWYEEPTTPGEHTYFVHHWNASWLDEASSPSEKHKKKNKKNKSKKLDKRIRDYLFRKLLKTSRKIHSELPKPFSPTSYSCTEYECVKTADGFSILVDPQELLVSPKLGLDGNYEPHEAAVIKKIIRGGDWVVDVGANFGYFSLLAAQRTGRFGRVFAFEPNPRARRLLEKSAVANWMQERIKIQAQAVTDSPGKMTLHVDDTVAGSASLLTDAMNIAAPNSDVSRLSVKGIEVQTTSLDLHFPAGIPIRLVKIDVEGAEGSVLQGMSKLLSEKRVDIVMFETLYETVGKQRHQLRLVLTDILALGYRLYTIHNQKLKAIDLTSWMFGENMNYFLVSPAIPENEIKSFSAAD